MIIAYPTMMSAASALAALRQSQGMQVSVVNVTDVYDEFNFGEKDPSAIKNFLQYTQTKWAKPRLATCCSSVARRRHAELPRLRQPGPRSDAITSRRALSRTASDDWFVDFNNDGLPDMAIGRIPVLTAADAATVISKITSYGQTTGAWTKNVLMAADANDANNDFEGASANVAAQIPIGYSVRTSLTGQIGGSAARTAIPDGINVRGSSSSTTTGHGFEQAWSSSRIFYDRRHVQPDECITAPLRRVDRLA